MMRKISVFLLLIAFVSCLAEYKIELNWDDFEGECCGYISGTRDNEYDFVSGAHSESAFSGDIVSVGEGRSWDANQVFHISGTSGFYTFWLKDKFADDDFNSNPRAIADADVLIKIFRDGYLIKQIDGLDGEGLACRVFSIDLAANDILEEIEFFPQARIITGRVLDAVTGDAISDAEISITDYMGDHQTEHTDENGDFIFPVDIGEYEVSVSQDGYLGIDLTVRMGADETPREIRAVLTKPVKDYRMVLTWGSSPKDLDAHLTGPDPNGGTFHIWYRNKILIDGRDFLDRDDTSSFGPETITIYKPADGEYYYSVHDYTNRKKKKSSRLSQSGARVDIYGDNRFIKSFELSGETTGNCWHVFKIDRSGNIIPVDIVDYIADEQDIR